MSSKGIVIVSVIAILTAWAFIRKTIRNYEERKKIERWKACWTAKRYSEFFKSVPYRRDLDQVVSMKEFLTAGSEISAESFLTALVQYHFVECKQANPEQKLYGYHNMYAKKDDKATARCETEILPVLTELLTKAVSMGTVDDVILLYYALSTVNKDVHGSLALAAASDYIRSCGFHIYDSIVSEQYQKWCRIINAVESRGNQDFSEEERKLFQIEGRLTKEDFLSTSKSAVGPYDEVQLNGHILRFYSEPHTYFIDGIRVLSVTQMLKQVDYSYANYTGISPAVLSRAAVRGTALHAEIQNYEEHGTQGYTQEFQNYLKLKRKNNFTVDTCEQYIIVYYCNIPICAGRFDLLIRTSDGKPAMADIKRTSTYKKDDVLKQINLYRMGYIQTYNRPIEEVYCLRLREDVAQFRHVDVDTALAQRLVERYANKLQENAKSYFELLQK